MKVLSFAVKVDPQVMEVGKPVTVEYPELNQMLEDGYQVIDMIPVWGTGDTYFLTFMVHQEKRRR